MTDYLDSLFSLEGKTALVTGGAKGIGRMISESLLQAGARVFISSRSVQDCNTAATEMGQHGDCQALPYDLSIMENIEALAMDLQTAGHGLDILVNNSGATWGAPLNEFPEAGWDKVMDLNVKAPFYLVQKLLPLLTAGASQEEPARIINIGSIAGLVAESQSAYSYMASKGAILHLTKGLAKDLADRHITVNAIAPGLFPSKMTKHLTSDDKVMGAIVSQVPLARMGEPQDIGGLAIFLSSVAGAYITGSVIPLGGGLEL